LSATNAAIRRRHSSVLTLLLSSDCLTISTLANEEMHPAQSDDYRRVWPPLLNTLTIRKCN
jgi:hypothetical protein